MTITQFKAQGWGANMKARYRDGLVYLVASVDFDEALVGLQGVVENEPEEVTWVRCENVDLLNSGVTEIQG